MDKDLPFDRRILLNPYWLVKLYSRYMRFTLLLSVMILQVANDLTRVKQTDLVTAQHCRLSLWCMSVNVSTVQT